LTLEASLEELNDGESAIVLRDRALPGAHTSVDHVVIARSGVWAIDVRDDTGMVQRIDRGGWFRNDYRLYVGSRLCTDLIGELTRSVAAIGGAIGGPGDTRVRGAVCFVGADWVLVERPVVIDGVWIGRPDWLAEQLLAPGPLGPLQVQELARRVAEALPPGPISG